MPEQTSSQVNWKRVGLITLTAIVILGILIVLWWWFFGRTPNEVTRTISPPTKTSTPSATPSAKKDETEDWKTYTNSKFNYSFKYPRSYTLKDSSNESISLTLGENIISFLSGQVELPLDKFTCNQSKDFNLAGKKTLYRKCTSDLEPNSGIVLVGGNAGSKYDNIPVAIIYTFKGNPDEETFEQILSTFRFE